MARRPQMWGKRVYEGYRMPDGTAKIWIKHPSGRRAPLTHHIKHSPTGFEWGYGGSGPADASRSILINAAGKAMADEFYQDFKFDVIGQLPQGYDEDEHGYHVAPKERKLVWVLTELEVIDWLKEHIRLQDTDADADAEDAENMALGATI